MLDGDVYKRQDYYIKEASTKLGFYQRIQRTKSVEKLAQLADEMVDRFGDIPKETANLMQVAELKSYCYDLRIKSIKQKAGVVHMSFAPDAQMDPAKLFEVAKKHKRRLNYSNASGEVILKLTIGNAVNQECLDLVKDVLLDLRECIKAPESLL